MRADPSDISVSDERSAQQWAQDVFGGASLGDKRLTARLVRLGAQCAARPSDSLPQACGDLASTKGAYRFVENKRVGKEAILQGAYQSTARRTSGLPAVLCVQDTTTLVFPTAREAAADFGYVNHTDLPGMMVHSTLALRENGVALGLLDVRMWARPFAERGKNQLRKQLPIEQKESVRWLHGIDAAREAMTASVGEAQRPRLIHVMDRERDIHEVFERIAAGGEGAVIRVTQNRRIKTGEGALSLVYKHVSGHRALGLRTVTVPRRGSREQREAVTAVRACRAELAPAEPYHTGRSPVALWLVEALEEDPPPGVEPLHWRLWTTEPAATFAQAQRVVEIYEKRWRIEDYHQALKSGCGVEKLRMHTGARIAKTIAIYAPVAARIVELRDLARVEPNAPCTEVLSDIEWRALFTAIHKAPPRADTPAPSIKQAVLWIGRLGGHLGRKGDGMPGITTLWRGLRDLELLAAMYQTLHPLLAKPPTR